MSMPTADWRGEAGGDPLYALSPFNIPTTIPASSTVWK
jgi:hypothetical protein